jgi:flavin-dependent dehydrogenase
MPIQKNTNTTNIIIIGAGPAGISTALHLIQKDPSWAERMIILEKARHPRPKLCGGGLTRFGLRILRNLDMPLPLPLPQAEVQDVIFRYGEREIHVRGKPQFIVFQRPMLDAYLAEIAKSRGVHIQEDEPVLDIKVGVDSINVTTPKGSYQADILIGADGSMGITRRLLKRSQGSRHVARLLETFIPATENADLFKSKQALFDFSFVSHDLQGYTWDFPSWVNGKPTFNRGIYDSRVIAQRPRASLPTLLSAFLKMDNTIGWRCSRNRPTLR